MQPTSEHVLLWKSCSWLVRSLFEKTKPSWCINIHLTAFPLYPPPSSLALRMVSFPFLLLCRHTSGGARSMAKQAVAACARIQGSKCPISDTFSSFSPFKKPSRKSSQEKEQQRVEKALNRSERREKSPGTLSLRSTLKVDLYMMSRVQYNKFNKWFSLGTTTERSCSQVVYKFLC